MNLKKKTNNNSEYTYRKYKQWKKWNSEKMHQNVPLNEEFI